MNRKGFTLIELLALIALIALLAVFVVPNLLNYLDTGYSKTLNLQKDNVDDAAALYMQDFCNSPINSNYASKCKLISSIDENGYAIFIGTVNLNVFYNEDYLEKVYFRDQECVGYTIFGIDETIISELKCGNYKTDGYEESVYLNAKN